MIEMTNVRKGIPKIFSFSFTFWMKIIFLSLSFDIVKKQDNYRLMNARSFIFFMVTRTQINWNERIM